MEINLFHAIISEIHFWSKLDFINKKEKLSVFLPNFSNIKYLIEYFDEFHINLSKYNLNSYIKSVSTQ